MSAGDLILWSMVALAVAGFSLCFSEQRGFNGLYLAALSVGVIAGTTLTVAGLMLADGWAERLQHFDFAIFNEHAHNRGRSSESVMLNIYSLPYMVAGAGAFFTYLAGRHLYARLSDNHLPTFSSPSREKQRTE